MARMNLISFYRIAILSFGLCLLASCTVDKLEARLQADPQCKSVMNAKTGALMPCPGTDKEFYRSIPALNQPVVQPSKAPITQSSGSAQASNLAPTPAVKTPVSAPVECKPQLHQKSGSLMPCPAP